MSLSGDDYLYMDLHQQDIDEALNYPLMQNILPDIEKLKSFDFNERGAFSNVCNDIEEHLLAVNPNEIFYSQDEEQETQEIIGSSQTNYLNISYDEHCQDFLNSPTYSLNEEISAPNFDSCFGSMSISHSDQNSCAPYSIDNQEGTGGSLLQEELALTPVDSPHFSDCHSGLSPYSDEAFLLQDESVASVSCSSPTQSINSSYSEQLSSKPKKSSRGRSSLSSSCPDSHVRARRQRLDHLTEEQKKDRIRRQNNEASQRYRQKKSQKLSSLDGVVDEEYLRKEKLELRKKEVLKNIDVLSRGSEVINGYRLEEL